MKSWRSLLSNTKYFLSSSGPASLSGSSSVLKIHLGIQRIMNMNIHQCYEAGEQYHPSPLKEEYTKKEATKCLKSEGKTYFGSRSESELGSLDTSYSSLLVFSSSSSSTCIVASSMAVSGTGVSESLLAGLMISHCTVLVTRRRRA